MKRTFIDVECLLLNDGTVIPQKLLWNDGRSWEITRVLHSCTSLDGEFEGIRYTVLIGNSEREIYLTGSRWYVDAGKEEAS